MSKRPTKSTRKSKVTTAVKAAPRPRATRSTAAVDNEAEVAGVRLSNPQRVLYPEQGITKVDLARYYEAIADWILPHVVHRPLSLVRCPAGRAKACFFQKHVHPGVSDLLGRIMIQEKYKEGEYLVLENLEGLVSLVQIGVLELHVWGSTVDDVERPDRLVFDLDPDEDLDWKKVIDAARIVRDVLADLGLRSFLKTSGGKGLHVVVPIQPKDEWEEVKQFCRLLVEGIASAAPQDFTAIMSKAARGGKIYLDYLRNDRGATAVAAYSTRKKEGAPVSAPIEWSELKPSLRADYFNVKNLPARLSRLKRDPWEELPKVRQSITPKMKKMVGLK